MDSMTIFILACLGGAFFIAGMLFEHWLGIRDMRQRRDKYRTILSARPSAQDEEGS